MAVSPSAAGREAALAAEIAELRVRLAEAEETLAAIRTGEVDALVVDGPRGPQIYTLRSADEPYRVLIEEMPEGALTLSDEGIILYANASLARLAGRPPYQITGRPLAELLAPGHDPSWIASGRRQNREAELVRPDGSRVPIWLAASPLPKWADGASCVVVGDLSDRRRREEAEAAERLARSVLDHAVEAVVVCDPAGRVTHASLAMSRLMAADVVGRDFASAFPLVWMVGDGNDILPRALAGQVVRGVEATLDTPAGRASLLVSAGPLFGTRDRIIGCVVTLTDITARKRAEERQQLLMAELSHRVKNTLATVQSICARTAARETDLAGFRQAFEGRLRALAETHSLLSDSHWDGVSLHALLRAELAPYGDPDGGRVGLAGPALDLSPRAALALGLVAHELATNAAKYGALSTEAGRIQVEWALRDGMVRVDWLEAGGPPVQPPRRRGFGRMLVERGIGHELGGQAEMDFRPTGLFCRISLPTAGALTGLDRDGRSGR